MSIRSELSMRIEADADVLHARRRARELASGMRFSGSDLTLIATAVSEIARNVVVHATRGEVLLRAVDDGHRRGLMVIVRDNGPGIADIGRAMQDGYSSSSGLGLGLPGSQRLMDEFDIASAVGKGTTVTLAKWER